MNSFGDEGLRIPGNTLKVGRFQNLSLREKVDHWKCGNWTMKIRRKEMREHPEFWEFLGN